MSQWKNAQFFSSNATILQSACTYTASRVNIDVIDRSSDFSQKWHGLNKKKEILADGQKIHWRPKTYVKQNLQEKPWKWINFVLGEPFAFLIIWKRASLLEFIPSSLIGHHFMPSLVTWISEGSWLHFVNWWNYDAFNNCNSYCVWLPDIHCFELIADVIVESKCATNSIFTKLCS